MIKKLFFPLSILLLVSAFVGYQFDLYPLSVNASWYLIIGLALLVYVLIRRTYAQQDLPWSYDNNAPQRITLTGLDYIKAMISWMDGFKRTYIVKPGLYYTGKNYDSGAPILVTANFRLTVFALLRKLRKRDTSLLIIDTDGINVWCSSGKQRFNSREILKQVQRYKIDTLTTGKRLELILPKLCLSGVDLQDLRKAGIKPVIGPIYAKDLPNYLNNPPYKDCDNDKVRFGFLSRLFTWLPGFTQMAGYYIGAALVFKTLLIPVPICLTLAVASIIVTAYPLLFPWLPGKQFAVKGIWLAGAVTLGLAILFLLGEITRYDFLVEVVFVFATGLFFGLSYTGNSAVSNYTKVRKETARFLPSTVILYLIFIVANVVKGVVT
jgi:hypothetical protein